MSNFEYNVPKLGDLSEFDEKFLKKIKELVEEYVKKLEVVKIKDGLKLFMDISSEGNVFFNEVKPWEHLKTDKNK